MIVVRPADDCAYILICIGAFTIALVAWGLGPETGFATKTSMSLHANNLFLLHAIIGTHCPVVRVFPQSAIS